MWSAFFASQKCFGELGLDRGHFRTTTLHRTRFKKYHTMSFFPPPSTGGSGGGGGPTFGSSASAGGFGGGPTKDDGRSGSGNGSGTMAAVAFDPKSPASMAIPRFEEEEGEDVAVDPSSSSPPSTSAGLVCVFDRACAGQGVSCNKFESSAITSMIEARDTYLQSIGTTTVCLGNGSSEDSNDDGAAELDGPNHTLVGLRSLSGDYRSALDTCVDQWMADRQENPRHEQNGMADEDEEDEDEQLLKEDLELNQVQLFYAVMHLSEIYLLIPDSSSSSSLVLTSPVGNALGTNDLMSTMMGGSGGGNGGYYGGSAPRMTSPFFSQQDSMDIPGGVSADTVRYLRIHHLGSAEDVFSEEVVKTLQTLEQPDQWNDGVDYWKLVMSYAVRGCLEDVWELLTHHSTYRRVEARNKRSRAITMMGEDGNSGEGEDYVDEDDYQTQWLNDVEAGFYALKCVLLSAPIPGGRNSNTDRDGFVPDDDEDEGDENDPNTSSQQRSKVDDSFQFIDGVPVGIYKFWEKTNSPSFDPQAAYEAFQTWQELLKENSDLQKLRSRIRPINDLLSLLGGNFLPTTEMFESWQEELCADILYKVPNIRPIDMNVRAKDAQDNHGSDNEAASIFDKLILSIMRGNAGSAIEGMQSLGGEKGGALSAVTTSLLAQLLSDGQALDSSPENTEIRTDLLIGASSAIRSSLSSEGRDDLGVRLVVQLLLPYVSRIGCDVRITANMVDAIEHHSPSSDTEANDLLSLCRRLVERKNVRVLDACSSICLARHIHYIREKQPAGATFWLAKGMEFESLVLCERSSQGGAWQRSLSAGSCYQRLVSFFSTTAQELLSGLCGEAEGVSLVVVRAKEMIEQGLNDSPLAEFISEVKVLKSVLAMAEAIPDGNRDDKVASCIITCLEEKPDEEDDGAVSCLASHCMHMNLLRLAVRIIERDFTRSDETSSAVSSFDVKGMGVLFATLTVLKASLDMFPKKSTPELSEDELHEAGSMFAQGLKRAFIVENTARRNAAQTKSRTPTRGVYSSNFARRPREEQERIVKSMLEI